ncbi:hypothetical protein ACVWXO_006176 [Bradyrhizobium sp. LM2.7]
MIAFLILHEATAIWDVRYASAMREISPAEQHVHSVLEMLPLTGLLLVIALHWSAFTALFGFGTPDFFFYAEAASATCSLHRNYAGLDRTPRSFVLYGGVDPRSAPAARPAQE